MELEINYYYYPSQVGLTIISKTFEFKFKLTLFDLKRSCGGWGWVPTNNHVTPNLGCENIRVSLSQSEDIILFFL